MKLPMNPSVYMCYMLYTNYDFKELVLKWNKEFKTYQDSLVFRKITEDMKKFRKKHWNSPRARGWSNFDTRHLVNFIKEHLYWG